VLLSVAERANALISHNGPRKRSGANQIIQLLCVSSERLLQIDTKWKLSEGLLHCILFYSFVRNPPPMRSGFTVAIRAECAELNVSTASSGGSGRWFPAECRL
jgi:hypothetical protein